VNIKVKNKVLFLLLAVLFLLIILSKNSYAETCNVSVTGTYDYSKAQEVLNLVNEKRKANGKSILTMDATLVNVAMQRAAENTVYWDHTRPNGSKYNTINGIVHGENIAVGQTSVSSVMNDWMNSSGHRRNILLDGFKSIGIACLYYNGAYYWVQQFSYNSASSVWNNSGKVTVTKTVNATRRDIATNNTITVGKINDSYEYTGSAITPSIRIVCEPDEWNYEVLKKDKDYVVSFENNTNYGIATMKITGIGLYTGTITKQFKITDENGVMLGYVENKQAEVESLQSTVTQSQTVAQETNAASKTSEQVVKESQSENSNNNQKSNQNTNNNSKKIEKIEVKNEEKTAETAKDVQEKNESENVESVENANSNELTENNESEENGNIEEQANKQEIIENEKKENTEKNNEENSSKNIIKIVIEKINNSVGETITKISEKAENIDIIAFEIVSLIVLSMILAIIAARLNRKNNK